MLESCGDVSYVGKSLSHLDTRRSSTDLSFVVKANVDTFVISWPVGVMERTR